MMRETEQPMPEPARRPDKRKAESEKPEELEEITDADIIESDDAVEKMPLETAGESVERMQRIRPRTADTADALTKKIGDLARQKEINANNTGLTESMAAKINAEIDKNIAALASRCDEIGGVHTSAPAPETIARSGGEKKAEKSEEQLMSERHQRHEEHEREMGDLEKLTLLKEQREAEDKELRLIMKETNTGSIETAKMIREARNEAKAEAERDKQKTEADFFRRGEAMDAARAAGETLPQTAAEQAGERSRERQLMAERAELLRQEIPGLQNAATAAERRLRREFGVADPDAVLRGRAESVWESAKGFFGGLFSKKEKLKNSALKDYRRLRDRLSNRQSELNEALNRLQHPEEVQKAMKLKAERRKP